MEDLKQATKRALLWSTFDKIAQQVIYLIIGIITARILTLGEVGMATSLIIFTNLSTMLLDSGLSIALIRNQGATGRDYSTVFFFNLTVSFLIYGALFFCSPLIADHYNNPLMSDVAKVMLLPIVINAFGLIQQTILVKRMAFRRLTVVNLTAIVISGVVSVTMAVGGYGVWSLVMASVVLSLVKVAMLWLVGRWTPQFVFCVKAFKTMFLFSYKLLISNLINSFATNIYSYIIAGYMPIAQVGLYNKANQIKDAGSATLWNAFGSSTYSMLAALQHDRERLKNAIRKTIRTLSFVTFPAMAGLAVVASPLIDVLITDKWAGAVPYMQLLCVAAVFFILSYVNANFIKIAGRTGVVLFLEILNAVTLILFFFLAIGYGLKTAIVSDIVSKVIVYIGYLIANSRIMDYKVREQLRDILPSAAITAVMCAGVWSLSFLIDNSFLLLASQIVCGSIIYIGINKLLGSTILDEILQTFHLKR